MDQKTCPTCGKPLPEDAVFCTNCGNKLPELKQSQPEEIEESATPSPSNDTANAVPPEITSPEATSPEAPAVAPSPSGNSAEPAAKSTSRKKPSRKTIIIAAVCVVLVAIIAFAIWFIVDQHNKQIWEQEHQKYPATVTISAAGYDPASSTPIPVHVEGTDFEGNTVSEDHLVGTESSESLSFMRGSYSLSVIASPITSDGTVYTVPDTEASFEITDASAEAENTDNDDSDASETQAAVETNITLEPMDPLSVTNDYIESIASALISAGMDESSVQSFKDAAINKMEEAVEEQRKQEISDKIDEFEAEYTAADNTTFEIGILGGQAAEIEASRQSYSMWEDLMNEVYEYLQEVLPADEAKQLASEQAAWEQSRDAEMNEAERSGMGSSFAPSFGYNRGSSLNQDRTRALIDMLYTLV